VNAQPSEGALLEVARAAARAAAEVLVGRFGGRQAALRSKSSPTDLVGEADLEAERTVREILAARRPDDAVLGEEGGGAEGSSGLQWIVDPLDGTTNYLYGIPHWAVSIACTGPDGALAGVVLDPNRHEEWAACASGPAELNGEPLGERPAPPPLAEALIGTGFGYEAVVRERQAVVASRLLPRVRDVRRSGSAALDLVWTAAGRLDAYFERGTQPWDEAAGGLLCLRAGLETHRLEAGDASPAGILAAPPELAGALLELVVS
jgi:myo-inositol-1(or 4)-monophosphatase